MKAATFALWASIVRTIVPIVVGTVAGWLTAGRIDPDPELLGNLTAWLTLGFAALYYVFVRLAETYVAPKLGWLLGLAQAPVDYSPDAKHRA
jgi:hypothetical protein